MAVPLSLIQHSPVMIRIQQEVDTEVLRSARETKANISSELALQQHDAQGIDNTLAGWAEKLQNRSNVASNQSSYSKSAAVSEITGVKMNDYGDFNAVIYACLFGSSLAVGVILLFSLLRKCWPAVFSRDISEPPRQQSTFQWIKEATTIEVEEVVEAAGLDGWLLLRFYDLNRRITTAIGPPLVLILCPLHYYASSEAASHMQIGLLSRFDITYVPDGSYTLWVHVILIWYVVLVSTSLMREAHEQFADLRYKWINSLPLPRATTVMVENVPRKYCSDEGLKQYFESVFGDGVVEKAYIVKQIPSLVDKVQHLWNVEYMLDLAEAVADASGSRDRNLEHAQAEMDKAKADVKGLQDAVGSAEATFAAEAGFVTFSSVFWARLATKQWYTQHLNQFIVSMPPDPSDVEWADLARPPGGSTTSGFLGRLALVLIFLFWTPVVVFISGFTTLTSLQEYVPRLAVWCADHPSVATLLQGVLSSLALRVVLALLPTILFAIITNFFFLKAGAWSQYHFQRTYFTFLVVFVLLVTAIGRSLIVTVIGLLSSPTSVVDLLAASLPGASHFYVEYLIIGWPTITFELIRSSNLLKYWFYRLTTSLDVAKCKHYSEPEDPAYYGIGSRVAMVSLYSVIAFVFCCCTPIVIFAAWLQFCLGRLVYGYLVVFAETKKPDLGGIFWVDSLRQVFFGLLVFVVLMFGVLLSKAGPGQYGSAPSLAVFAALIPLYVAWARFNDLAWEQLPLQDVAKVSKERLANPGPRVGEYVQRQLVHDHAWERRHSGTF
jgi:hypothetical protein